MFLRSGHRRALKINLRFTLGGRRYKKSSFLQINDFPHARTVRTSTKTTTTTSTYLEGQRNIAAVWPRGALLKCHKVQHQLNHTSSKRKWGGHFMWLQQQKRGHCFPLPHLFKSAPIEFVLVALPAFLSRIVRQPWSWPTDRLAHLYFFFVARFFFF